MLWLARRRNTMKYTDADKTASKWLGNVFSVAFTRALARSPSSTRNANAGRVRDAGGWDNDRIRLHVYKIAEAYYVQYLHG